MQCPACEERLSKNDYNGLAVGRCDTCKGSWLTGRGFADLTRMDGSGLSPRDVVKLKVLLEYRAKNVKPTEHPCPKCSAKLRARNYAEIAGFFIEQCPKGCGVWVREGDLDRIRILNSLGRSEEVKTRARPAQKAKAAASPEPSGAPKKADPRRKSRPAKRQAAKAEQPPPRPPEEEAPQPKKGFLARMIARVFGRG